MELFSVKIKENTYYLRRLSAWEELRLPSLARSFLSLLLSSGEGWENLAPVAENCARVFLSLTDQKGTPLFNRQELFLKGLCLYDIAFLADSLNHAADPQGEGSINESYPGGDCPC